MENKEMEQEIQAWIGIDWADQKHDASLFDVKSGRKEVYQIQHTPESLQEWLGQLRKRYPGGYVAIVLEQSRGALLNALISAEFLLLYPINPQSLSSYRQAFYGSGAKDDPVDAELMQEMVRQNPSRFRCWSPEDELTRSLRLLTEGRRKLVDESTALTNRLTSLLKTYYPQALEWAGKLDTEWACDFLDQWPSLQSLQLASRRQLRLFYQRHSRSRTDLETRWREYQQAQALTHDQAAVEYGSLMVQALIPQLRVLIKAIAGFERRIAEGFHKHPDRQIFESFPGAGAALAPRLMTAFGVDRDRFQDAKEAQQAFGIAPVTERSGTKKWVHWRWACSKFVRQTLQEFAEHSRRRCSWAKAYYQLQIGRGKDHHAAVRALAYKWIRILFRCWKDRTEYRDEIHSQSLIKRQSPLAQALASSTTVPVVELAG